MVIIIRKYNYDVKMQCIQIDERGSGLINKVINKYCLGDPSVPVLPKRGSVRDGSTRPGDT